MDNPKGCLRALVGLFLVFIYHVPRLLYRLLKVSYAWVFNNHENLTASPAEHLSRARRRLKSHNSQLLYAALEIRFALERMIHTELIFASKATERSLKEYDPIKKLRALHRLDEATKHPHTIYLIDRATGERHEWGQYKPLDLDRIAMIQGRLGDLLHPKTGLALGVWDDPWYVDTRAFLRDAESYLSSVLKGNSHFFGSEGLAHIDMVRAESSDRVT
jgi:hypothetical protein